MQEWYEITEGYIENERVLSYRPVNDRVDEKGHYFLYNIQPLSFSENSRKARANNR